MEEAAVEAGSNLLMIDLAVIILYIGGIVIFGAYFFKKTHTVEAWTVGDRSLPGWAIGLSILGTYLSSISFLANPGKSYGTNWSSFVSSLTLPIACLIAAQVFIPMYRGKLQTTAYQHLENRFGYWARAYTAGVLILLQIGRIGVVLYLVALAMVDLLGWQGNGPLIGIICVLGVLTIAYTVLGGIEAVIWTDVVQTIVLMVGALVCVVIIIYKVPGGTGYIFDVAAEHNKFGVNGFSFDLKPLLPTFWIVFIFGVTDNLKNFGIDQNYVQRFLAAKSDREARKSLWIGGLLYIPVSALFFFIGTALFAFYHENVPASVQATPDSVFSYFIVHELPAGITGLLIAGILAAGMSTLDSSINSSATVWVVDFHKRLIAPDCTEHEMLNMTRISTVAIGVIGTLASIVMIGAKSALDTWWMISGILGGGMIGLFLLGVLVRNASRVGAIAGVIAGVLVIGWGTLSQNKQIGEYIPVFPADGLLIGFFGTLTIIVVGALVSIVTPGSRSAEHG